MRFSRPASSIAMAWALLLPLAVAAQTQTTPPNKTPPQSPPPWLLVAPEVSVGRIERIDKLTSKYVDSRPIDVWLPPGYNAAKRYAVLYMHDGQMLFDAGKTWNKAAWNVHEVLSKLMQAGQVRDIIVVGIPNNGKYRYSEYYPKKILAMAPKNVRSDYRRRAQNGFEWSDRYLKFVVRELKPAIDRRYSTLTDRDNTFVMGSSMGGLISLYALCEYPEVFGAAAGLSTHWVGRPSVWGFPDKLEENVQNAALPLAAFNYLQKKLPRVGSHRLYLDHGTMGLDGLYGLHQSLVNQVFRERGYTNSDYSAPVVAGAGHSEADWSRRLEVPLTFLLSIRGGTTPQSPASQ